MKKLFLNKWGNLFLWFGIYPAVILDAIHYSVSTLIYSFDFTIISCDASRAWGLYLQDITTLNTEELLELDMYYLLAILFMLFIFIFDKKYLSNITVKPHAFATTMLQSDAGIAEIVAQINSLLPQLANFISQFNTTVIDNNITVITDSIGNMDITVPKSMSDEMANTVSTKIGIIDRLITTHGQNINDLLNKGIGLENKLKLENSNYVSQLADKIEEFKRLNSSYKH